MLQRILILVTSVLCLCFYILAFSSDLSFTEAKGDLCPRMLKKLLGDEESCEKVTCKTSLTARNCPENTEWQENLTLCGCCPGCVKRVVLNPGDECIEPYYEDCGEKFCPVIITQCLPNHACSKDTNTCGPLDVTEVDLKECEKKRIMGKAEELHWTPNCNPDGSYAAVQCKGERNKINAMCFCSDKTGKRIFGRRRWVNDMSNMTCGCSLHAHELRQSNQIVTIHCTYDGNYEPLQCDQDSGLCFCVEPLTGKITGAVLPANSWKELPCYTDSMGDTYLRQCDSIFTARERINTEALLHGLQLEKFRSPDCDYDGSYKRYQENGQFDECVHKNGDRNIYFRTSGHNKLRMDCNCAREYEDYEQEGLIGIIPRACDDRGNFNTIAEEGNRAVCVDEDGFVSYQVPLEYRCCLEGKCGNEDVQKCFPNDQTPGSNGGYKHCDLIPT